MSETPPPPPRRLSPRLWGFAAGATALIAVIVVVVVLVGSGGSGQSASSGSGSGRAASSGSGPVPPLSPGRAGPESMVTSARELIDNPVGTIDALHALGVDRVHVPLFWNVLAPDSSAIRRPAVDLADPASYPASGWAPYDAIVHQLKVDGVGIDLAFFPPAPRWASGPGAPHPARQTMWKPNAADFGQFVRAVATRYSGHYTPPGASSPLPRVAFWSIWNEPDLGAFLAPEAIDHSQVEEAARLYRGLLDAAWVSLHQTGHGADTILFGELAPAGIHAGSIGDFNSLPPLRFVRALYCVDAGYRALTGEQAALRGCPMTAAASASFAAQHPALFHASGVAVHPYPQGLPPNAVTPNEPDYAELAALPRFAATIDRVVRVYHLSTRFPIWSTEFGYQTKPPDPENGVVSPTTAAYYLNWAEYITWNDPRLRSFDQYLLTDPPSGYFASGLLTASGVPKPGYFAYRMPLFLPVTSGRRGQPLDVWGCVRPAPDAARTTHRRQIVVIQFHSGAAAPWRTIRAVALINGHGYFEVRQSLPASGQVRLAWTPPHAGPIYSRNVDVTLR